MSSHDDQLKASTRRFLPAPGAAYFAPDPDAALDQGDVCDEDGHAHDAPVTDGVCGWCGEAVGEWIEVGYLDGDALSVAGQVYVAPLGTPMPTAAPADLDAIGPPIPVLRQETRPDGHYVEVSVGPAHPAYAALAELASDLHVSVDLDGPRTLSDNDDYVRSRPGSARPPAVTDGVPLPSATVSGLGPAEIARRRHVPPPQAIGLGDVVAGLFGARLTGDPDEPVAEITTVRPNRADRRRAARSRRRG